MTAGELASQFELTWPTMSGHFAVLKEVGLVGERSEGRRRYYQLRAAPLAEVRTWLNRYRAHLERQLDALGDVLDSMPPDPGDPPRAPARSRKGGGR